MIALGLVLALAALATWWALRNAPTCTCGREECGGGCIPR